MKIKPAVGPAAGASPNAAWVLSVRHLIKRLLPLGIFKNPAAGFLAILNNYHLFAIIETMGGGQ
jgi:hypothetical protein